MVDFCKFDNFRGFFCDNSSKNYHSDLPKGGKDASRWDLNLSGQKFSSKINSSAGILEKSKKMAFIAVIPSPPSNLLRVNLFDIQLDR